MIMDVKRPFRDICIHGQQPQLILPFLQLHNQRFDLKSYNVTLVDYLPRKEHEHLLQGGLGVREVRHISGPDSWIPEEQYFDLLISSLQTHHANDQEDLFRKYIRSLKPDGALVGTNFVEGTLRELYWAYLLAEN
jgi:SAM-dependent methyltransferase